MIPFATHALADIPPGPRPGPPILIVPVTPLDPGLPDIRLEKQLTATLADPEKGTILRIPKAWLVARESTTQPAAAPTTHADAKSAAAMETTLAGLLLGTVIMISSWQLARRRPVSNTFLTVAGAALILLAAGIGQADIAPRPRPAQVELQVAPNQTSGPITLETTDSGDQAELIIARDVVHTLFAKADKH
jgi:hypothetical protein